MKRITVAYDGSENALHALRWAAAEARLHHADLLVVHGYRPHRLGGAFGADASEDIEQDREAARRVVEEGVAALGDTAGLTVRTEIVGITERGMARELLRARRTTELMVLGSRGLGGFAGLLLGSTSQNVAAHARMPVVVVPAGAPIAGTGGRIVVGVDESDHARRALAWASHEATARRVPLLVVGAAAGALMPAGGMALAVDIGRAAERQTAERDRLETVIREMVDTTAPEGVDVEIHAVVDTPARALLDASKDAALVVVGSRGRGGFASLVLGSTSQQVLHHAAVPVVVVRGEDDGAVIGED